MQTYLRQWVSSAVSREKDGELVARVAAIQTHPDVEAAIKAATKLGMDPL
jgi:hypothetical protein